MDSLGLQSFCKYSPPFIPPLFQESAFSLISVCLEFCILLFLLSCILRKKWYQCRGEQNKARSLLLPFYDRVLYFYCGITVLRIVFYSAQFIFEVSTGDDVNTAALQFRRPWWIIAGDAVGVVGALGLQVFIIFLLMQTSAGTNAYRRAFRATMVVCVLQLLLFLFKRFYVQRIDESDAQFRFYCAAEMSDELLMLCIFAAVFAYSYCYHQIYKNRKRRRNHILYVYIALLCIHFVLAVLAYTLLLNNIDAYCIDVIDEYIFRLVFPLLAFITIRSDSEFWRRLLLEWQTASTLIGEEGDKEGIWDQIKSIFGTSSDNKQSFLNPLIDALSMGVKMVDFTQLQEETDPIAMGSTATVSKAKLYGETVAIKVFIFDELSIEVVSEFFRESLLISDLHHINIVEFKGACLRPPELCLVYEFCNCGDLTHLLLSQYFHSNNFAHNADDDDDDEDDMSAAEEDGFPNSKKTRQDPKSFSTRIAMLMDVARGMTRLHDSGIIHRDLKTSNVLVHCARGQYRAKVCDFGSARRILAAPCVYAPAAMPTEQQQPQAPNSNSNSKSPRTQHAKSAGFVKAEMPPKQVAKNGRAKTIASKPQKKHEIVMESKVQKPHKSRTLTTSQPPSQLQSSMAKANSQNKKDVNHNRAMTAGFFNKIKPNKQQQPAVPAHVPAAPPVHCNGHALPTRIDELKEEKNDLLATGKIRRQAASTSTMAPEDYDDEYDMDEEEKYDRPTNLTTQYGGEAPDDDTMSEAPVTFDGDKAARHRRDPTKLAFNVSPILLTTQVGTLAFLAPEILSHVNIAALSGGFNFEEAAPVETIMEDEEMDEFDDAASPQQPQQQQKKKKTSVSVDNNDKQFYHKRARSSLSSVVNKPLPPSLFPTANRGPSGNHLAIESNDNGQQPRGRFDSEVSDISDFTADDPNVGSLQSESTVVMRIRKQSGKHDAQPMSYSTTSTQLQQRTQQPLHRLREEDDFGHDHGNQKHLRLQPRRDRLSTADSELNEDVELEQVPSSRAKKFSREYVRKHEQLSSNRNQITAPPKKALPPSPEPRSFGSALRKMFTAAPEYDSWQNRDIYFFNQPNNDSRACYQNAFSQYTKSPSPYYRSVMMSADASPNVSPYQIGFRGSPSQPQQPLTSPNLRAHTVNATQPPPSPMQPQPQPPRSMHSQQRMPQQLQQQQQYQQSPSSSMPHPPMATHRRGNSSQHSLRLQPKNVDKYVNRALPPDPPKSKKKKIEYYTRGRDRASSKYGTLRRKNSRLRKESNLVDDHGIYETQKFEIVYESADSALYNDSVDVYSFGVIMWEVALCKRVYDEMDMKQIRDMVCEGRRMAVPPYEECKRDAANGLHEVSTAVYNAFLELLNECWAQSPIDRPSFYQIENRLEVIASLHAMKMEQKRKKVNDL